MRTSSKCTIGSLGCGDLMLNKSKKGPGNNFDDRMKNSLVLIVNLTPTCTELARHLVLSGINIRLIDEARKMIDSSDIESDFLFN